MSGLYLTPDELKELTGYVTRAGARKWLERNAWPFASPGGDGWPRVLRQYHDDRLSGLETKSRPRKYQEPAWSTP